MPRTPLLSGLLKAWRQLVLGESAGPRRQEEDRKGDNHQGCTDGLSRRDFLRLSAAGAAWGLGAGLGAASDRKGNPSQLSDRPRVGIVGAGLSGLAAADVLVRSGAEVRIFDARGRVGGRVRTLPDALAPGLPGELGGEFINSDHRTTRGLIRRFRLPVLDTLGPGEESFRPVYAIAREPYALDRAARDLAAFFQQQRKDLQLAEAASGAGLATNVDPALRELDQMSLADYLSARNCPQPLRDLLETAYTTEFGADTSHQSALNLLIMFAGEDPESWQTGHGDENNPDVLGSSDERFKLVLGSESLAGALQAAVVAQQAAAAPRLEHRLTAIRADSVSTGGALDLIFDQVGGGTVTHRCDRVILAIPFLQLRKVDLGGVVLEEQKNGSLRSFPMGGVPKSLWGLPVAHGEMRVTMDRFTFGNPTPC